MFSFRDLRNRQRFMRHILARRRETLVIFPGKKRTDYRWVLMSIKEKSIKNGVVSGYFLGVKVHFHPESSNAWAGLIADAIIPADSNENTKKIARAVSANKKNILVFYQP